MLKFYGRKVTESPPNQITDPFWIVIHDKTRNTILMINTTRL